MRRIILLFLITAFMMLACSCDQFIDPDIEGEKRAEELLEYLSDKDEDGLKSMFCERLHRHLYLINKLRQL